MIKNDQVAAARAGVVKAGRRLVELKFGCEVAELHLQASFAVTPPDTTVSPPTFRCCRLHRRDRQHRLYI